MLPLLACSILFQYGIPPEYSSIKWYPSPSFGSENRIILQESTHHHFLMKSYWHCHLKQLFLPPFPPFFPSQGGRPILSVVASCSHRRPLRSKASQRSSWVSNGFFLWNFRNLRMDFWMDYLIEFGLLEVLPRFICAQFSLDPQDSEFECTTPLTSGWTMLMTSNVSLENHRNCVGGRGERWKISPRHPRMWSVAHEVLATCSASGCLAAQMSESIAGHELNIGLNDIKIIKNHQKASKIIKNHQKSSKTHSNMFGLGVDMQWLWKSVRQIRGFSIFLTTLGAVNPMSPLSIPAPVRLGAGMWPCTHPVDPPVPLRQKSEIQTSRSPKYP